MPKKDQLFYLINSLTKSEKRYFKLFSGLHKGDKVYIKLFDDIDAMKEVDMGALHEKHVDPDNPGQGLTLKKRYLSESIMRCLRMYHSESSLWMIIQNGLNDIEILYNKRLGAQCLRTLIKTRSLAEKYEKFALQIQVLDWERRLKTILEETPRTTEEITEEEKITIHKKINFIEIEHLFSKSVEFKRKYGYVRGTLQNQLKKDVLGSFLLQDVRHCMSQRATFYFYYIHALTSSMLQNYLMAYEYSKKLNAADPDIAGHEDYLNGINEHITACACQGYFEEAIRQISFVEKFVEGNSEVHHNINLLRLFYYKAHYLILCYIYMGEEPKLRRTVKWVEKEMEVHKNLLSTSPVRLQLISQLLHASLSFNDIDKARIYLNEILNTPKKHIRKDIYDETLICNLFLWLEAGEYDVLKSALHSAYRYFHMNNADGKYDIELRIINAFVKCKNFSSQKLKIQLLKNIKTTIQQYIQSVKKFNNFHEQYQFYVLYADSRLNDVPFHEAARNWYVKHGAG